MAPDKKIIWTMALILIIIAVILVGQRDRPPVQEERCGIENCHGMDLTCGPNVPDACTEEYRLGDRCRQYADCKIVEGRCSLVKNDSYDECKACVEGCLKDYEEDNMKAFECESRCPFTVPDGSAYCVDNFGNPMDTAACGKIGLLDRLCSESNECTATCGLGCMNKEAYLEGVVDCKAIPQYECICAKGFCQKKI